MGMIFSSCKCRHSPKREITLLMIGLDNAGKTSTAKHLLGESTEDVVPTVGFSSVKVKHNQFDITIFDLGGGHKIRGIWKNYYASVHGIIFIVDASESERIEECRKEITIVLQDARISGKPMLLLINKQDIQGALDEAEICTMLELESIVNKQECPTRVETCSAISINSKKRDKGIDKGFQWLIGHIEKYYKELEERVQRETNEQKQREEKERLERMERVRKIREEREKQEAEVQNKENDDDDDDNDVIIGTPFKPASKIIEELNKKEAKQSSSFEPSSEVKVIHVSPSNSHNKDANNEITKSPVTDSEVERQASSSAELDSDISNSQNLQQNMTESTDGHKKVKRKSKKRFKNKVAPDVEMSKPRELPVLHHPLSPHNGWIENSQIKSPIVKANAESINWALAEELLPCGDSTETKSQKQENIDWIQPDVSASDSPCNR